MERLTTDELYCDFVDCDADHDLCGVCEARKRWERLQAYETRARTNGDRIRAMSDEELGKYLGAAFHCYGCPARKFCDSVDHLYECHETLAAWLQQPYKEEA